jgi:hypothetical protein
MGNALPSNIVEIDGKYPLDDPLEEYYTIILDRISKLTWDQFEKLTEKTIKEMGFIDVHRLTRGSQ